MSTSNLIAICATSKLLPDYLKYLRYATHMLQQKERQRETLQSVTNWVTRGDHPRRRIKIQFGMVDSRCAVH